MGVEGRTKLVRFVPPPLPPTTTPLDFKCLLISQPKFTPDLSLPSKVQHTCIQLRACHTDKKKGMLNFTRQRKVRGKIFGCEINKHLKSRGM